MAAGSMSGVGAIIVMDDFRRHWWSAGEPSANLRTRKLRPMHAVPGGFALDEPRHCIASRMAGRKQERDYLVKIADNIPGGRTICAFGEACSWPVQSFVAKFKE